MRRLVIFIFIPLIGLFAQNAWINEIHYDNFKTDQDEMIEVVIENASSYTLSDFTLTLYNGNNNKKYGSKTLDQFTQGTTDNGFTFFYHVYPSNGIQNGEADGMALDYQGTVITGQFLSYEGTLTAADGPANGMTSVDIGVMEPGPVGKSLQLGGSGASYDAFFWQDTLAATPGAININQDISTAVLPEPSNHVTAFSATATSSSQVELSWTGATGSQLPSKYLILAKTGSGQFAAVADGNPVSDDTDWSDDNGAFNVGHKDGANTFTVSGLQPQTAYDFIIYPYTNSGSAIDFKTDGSVPATSVTTLAISVTAIADIQTTASGQEGDSPLKGQDVTISGIVTGKTSSGYFVQDEKGAWNGIYVDDGSNAASVNTGDSVVVSGTVEEHYNFTQLSAVVGFELAATGKIVPAAVKVATGSFAQEKYEGVLVRTEQATCTNADLGYGEWEINDGSGACAVDDWIFAFSPVQGTVYNVTGIGDYAYSEFKIEPRNADDIEIWTAGPKIKNLAFAPLAPLATEDFTDTVQVTDDDVISSVMLRYTVSGGAVNELVMTQAGNDSTFAATIPASEYGDGDRVEFWAYAENANTESTEGSHQGFFAGETPLAGLNEVDGDGNFLYAGFGARVTGTATVGDGVFDTEHMHFYMQDADYGAIKVFEYNAVDPTIVMGKSYTVLGKLEQDNGMLQITPLEITDNGEGALPQALEENVETLLAGAEQLQGILVKVISADTLAGTEPWPAAGSNATLSITDDAGAHQMDLRIDKDTDIDDAPQPSWPQTIIGLFTQYDYQSPYLNGYQILPRFTSDMSGLTGIENGQPGAAQPKELQLYSAYPNPFNPNTTLRFYLPSSLSSQKAELLIYNNLGQKVKVLFRGQGKAGLNEVRWNGRSDRGKEMASGIYYAVLNVGGHAQSQKLLLLK